MALIRWLSDRLRRWWRRDVADRGRFYAPLRRTAVQGAVPPEVGYLPLPVGVTLVADDLHREGKISGEELAYFKRTVGRRW